MTPFLSGGLEAPLSLVLSCKEKWVINTMEKLVGKFYSFEYSGDLHSTDDTNGNNDDNNNDYHTITFETEDAEEE